jgi:hypothetical protein
MEAFHYGKAPFNYGAGYPNDGWRTFLPFVIDTYKNGVATVTKEGLIGWWWWSAASACGDGGTTGNTASQLQLEFAPGQVSQDRIFFTALLGSAADVSVTIGGTIVPAQWTAKPDSGIGLHHSSANFTASHRGDVAITIRRGNAQIAAARPGASGSIGPQSCVNGLTNCNALVAVDWSPSTISATPALKRNQQGYIQGTGTGNFRGLCEFNCRCNCQPLLPLSQTHLDTKTLQTAPSQPAPAPSSANPSSNPNRSSRRASQPPVSTRTTSVFAP